MLRLVPTPTPRYVTCTSHDTEDGNSKEYTWDPTYISVAQDLLDDELMLQNAFEGKIVSSQIYPLVFDSKGPHKEMSFRSLEFYREVDQNNDIYKQLSFDEKHFFLIGLRDLFVASCRDILSESEKELLKRIADIIDPNEDDSDIVSKEILNMQVTPYPTCSHKMVRFIDYPADAISSLSNECFIRNELNMLIGFVDPCELSYHNFENIVNLDSLFDNHFDQFKIINGKQLQDSEVFTFDMLCASDVLETLDKHNLYVQPLNKLSRGGRRFIFSSRTLSNNLTTCLKVYMNHTKIVNNKFRFVNWVFRYNKFKPDDKKFVCHYDTPYTDPAKKHHSKYTILLYLSSGKADPVLSFDNGKVIIDSIEANWHQIKGVIFDQKYEHEGKSFIDTDKIFLRSELVYEYVDGEYVSDNQVAKKFNQACYMTKQSLFNPEIEKFVSDAFNQAAEARVGLSRKFQTKDILVYKKLDEVPFITNGYDYWFNKDTDLKDAAVLTISDFFNCKHESGKYFNKISYQKIINVDLNHDEILDFLNDENGKGKILENARQKSEKKNGHQKSDLDDEDDEECREEIHKKVKTVILSNGKDPNKGVSQEKGTEMEIEEGSEERETKSEDESDHEDEAEGEEEGDEDDDDEDDDRLERKSKPVNCCPDHYNWSLWKQRFDPKTNKDVLRYLKQGQQREKIDTKFLKKECVVYILDCKMDIQRDNIFIYDTTIRFKNHIPGFNFAGSAPSCDFCGQKEDDDYFCCEESVKCWHTSEVSEYVKMEEKSTIEYRCLPPIPYITSKKGHHLRLDIFHSDLIRSQVSTIKHYTM